MSLSRYARRIRFRPLRFASRGRSSRRGAAVVEFALLAPILFLVVLAIMEFGRGMMVGEMLNTAARSGCRAATVLGSTNANVNGVISQCLSGISGTSVTIQVNGKTVDVSSASRGDTITVQISVPYASVSWLPNNNFLDAVTVSGGAAMYHE